ncbi:MAG: hypothetical protein ABIW82_10725 [Dokdonella sp.]
MQASMTREVKHQRLAWFVPLALLVYFANAWFARHPPPAVVATGTIVPEWPMLFDLLVTVPLAYLIAFRRQGRQPWMGAAMLAGTGVMVAGWIVPEQSRHWLGFLQAGRNLFAAVVVLGEIALALSLARLTLRLLRDGNDPERAVAAALHARFGDTPVARLLAFEVRLWFYALFATAKRRLTFAGDEHFSCHAKDGHASNQQGFILLILIELPIVHVLLSLFWQWKGACVVSALSLWGLCFLIAERRATLRRPISMDGDRLYVRYGLGAELVVPLARITAVAPHRDAVARRIPDTLRYCESGAPNICVRLSPALDVPGLFGGSRKIEWIYLGVDAPGRFLSHLSARLPNPDQAITSASTPIR